MNRGISLAAFGHASSLCLTITFVLCVGFDLLFPARRMYEAWQALLPGFTWISWSSFFLGLAESHGYGWYLALIWVPLYNVFALRGQDCCVITAAQVQSMTINLEQHRSGPSVWERSERAHEPAKGPRPPLVVPATIEDPVDEASEESFPASDPPAWTPSSFHRSRSC